MNADSNIFKIVQQKVKSFSSKFSTEYFLAEQKRKHLGIFSFHNIELTTIVINYQFLADTFRQRVTSTIWRATSAKRRAESTMWRATSAKRRAMLTTRRAISAIRRVELTICRTISAIRRAALAMQQGTSTIHFKEAETWFLTHSF
jgi:hypothetical protein